MRRPLLFTRIIPTAFSGWLGNCLFILAMAMAHDLYAESKPTASGASVESIILVIQGCVEVALAGSDEWRPARVNQVLRPGDRLRTGPRSRAEVRASDLSDAQSAEPA